MLIGIGQDIQRIEDLARTSELRTPGVFFTDAECAHAGRSSAPVATFAGLFSAKEALFKTLPEDLTSGFFWSDIEVAHGRTGKPMFHLHGAIGRAFAERGWRAELSISHSGEYASAVAVVVERPRRAADAPSG